ncbi:condensation domain-containing protein, partial [Pectobacterium betavasculorum]
MSDKKAILCNLQPVGNRENAQCDLIFPLSSAQRGMWFAQHLNHSAKPQVFKAAEYLEILSPLDTAIFEKAARIVVEEAPSLRMTLHNTPEGPCQRLDLPSDWTFPLLDFSQESDSTAAAERWMRNDQNTPFNLSRGPLFSFALLQLAPERFFFYHSYHHAILDGYGAALLVRRMAEVYSDLLAGNHPRGDSFASLTDVLDANNAYEASTRYEQDRQYWMKQLIDQPAPVSLAQRQATCSDIVRRQQYLPQHSHLQLRDIASRHGVALPQLLISLIAIYLKRITSQDDLLLGLPMTARSGSNFRRFPGMVSNVLPLRLRLSDDDGIAECLSQTKSVLYGAGRHQRYRGESISADLGLIAQGSPLYSTSINIIPFQYDDIRFGDAGVAVHNLALGPSDDLMITVLDRGTTHGLELCLTGNASLYDEDDLACHLRRLMYFFAIAEDNLPKKVGDYELLSPQERDTLMQWGAAQSTYPSTHCIHEQFEAQAQARPDATAVVCQAQSLRYGELNARANQLAHWLIELGIRPDSRVAIALERSCELPVAILATLKAGGGYVPLDPSYPQERLQYMLEDSEPAVLITTRALLPQLGELPQGLGLIVLDAESRPWEQCPSANISPARLGLTANHLAYIIYTSGSTGRPKGV